MSHEELLLVELAGYFIPRVIVAGVVLGGIALGGQHLMSKTNEIRIFEEAGKPKVIREYKLGLDKIFVEFSDRPNFYIPLKDHLKAIEDKYDRQTEELRIKKQIDW